MTDPRITQALTLHTEGQGPTAIGRVVGVGPAQVEGWLKTHLHTTCGHCGTNLRNPSTEENCGLCAEELELGHV